MRPVNGAQRWESRFWAKVNKTETCWLWTASTTTAGYGQFHYEARRMVMAHRMAYELIVGPIPDGLELDHLCRIRRCVNPAHLEAVTRKENVRRGLCGAMVTVCPRGHEYTTENTRLDTKGWRRCRTCHRDWERVRRSTKAVAS